MERDKYDYSEIRMRGFAIIAPMYLEDKFAGYHGGIGVFLALGATQDPPMKPNGRTVCLDIGTLASICDVRRTTQAVTETADRIKVGDEVEVFQATISPWTVPSEVGIRGVVTGIMSEIGWLRDSENCIDVAVVEIGEDNAFALCDVRKVC
jgi:F0F1-type ATP synthase assembly protein I